MLSAVPSDADNSEFNIAEIDRISVGPFTVADTGPEELANSLLSSYQQRVAYALHVGGLNARQDKDFVRALENGTVVYADGAAVVLLAKLAGATHIVRTPTTDFGWLVINKMANQLGRNIRVAIIGGPPGLADAAGQAISAQAPAELVFSTDGYKEDYCSALVELNASQPDIVLIGMGMPREAKWVEQNLDHLPKCLILTCGGWLGFLAGEESRAPVSMQRLGLEWLFRLGQAPKRLFGRYAFGLISTISLIPGQLRLRADRKFSVCGCRSGLRS